MLYMYYCPKCKRVFSKHVEIFNTCPQCGSVAIPTNVSEDDWKNTSDEVKTQITTNLEGSSQHTIESASKSQSSHANSYGQTLHTIGIIAITLCIIVGIVIACDENALIGIIVAIMGSFEGFIIMAFGEVINLLQDIKNK